MFAPYKYHSHISLGGMAAKLVLAAALAVSFDVADGFAISSGSCLRMAKGCLHHKSVVAKPRGFELAMSTGKEQSMSRRNVAGGMLLVLAAPTLAWAEEEESKPTRTYKIWQELRKEAKEEEERAERSKKKDEGQYRMGSDLREELRKEREEEEEEEKGFGKKVAMRQWREQSEQYLKNFKHESEDLELAVEVAENEHFMDQIVAPVFYFVPFVFLWSGFKVISYEPFVVLART